MTVLRHRDTPIAVRLLATAILLPTVLFRLPPQAFRKEFAPLSVSSETSSIRLSVVGTHRGGMYSTKTPASPPGYDPETKRLFLGGDDREALEALDISDPRVPRKVFAINLTAYGGAPDSLAVAEGLVAVTVKNTHRHRPPRHCKVVAHPVLGGLHHDYGSVANAA